MRTRIGFAFLLFVAHPTCTPTDIYDGGVLDAGEGESDAGPSDAGLGGNVDGGAGAPYTSVPSATAVELWQLINEYRADNGKPAVALSSSLTLVANAHGWDSATNGPVQGTCNLHPRSDRGPWDECCYTADHNNYPDTGGSGRHERIERIFRGRGFPRQATRVLRVWALRRRRRRAGALSRDPRRHGLS